MIRSRRPLRCRFLHFEITPPPYDTIAAELVVFAAAREKAHCHPTWGGGSWVAKAAGRPIGDRPMTPSSVSDGGAGSAAKPTPAQRIRDLEAEVERLEGRDRAHVEAGSERPPVERSARAQRQEVRRLGDLSFERRGKGYRRRGCRVRFGDTGDATVSQVEPPG